MNKEIKAVLITGLKQMLDGHIVNKDLGICANLCTHLPLYHEDLAYDLVRDCGEKWYLTSGNRWHPVQPESCTAPKWEGLYLAHRKSLIRSIIHFLES